MAKQGKTEALAIYLDKKGLSLERSLGEFLEKLYEKTVPGQVKKYLAAKQKPAENPVLHTPGTACPAGGKQRGLGVRIAAGGKASGTVVLDEQASHFFSKAPQKVPRGTFPLFSNMLLVRGKHHRHSLTPNTPTAAAYEYRKICLKASLKNYE